MPYVFTEQGIAMLSGLLRNEIAIQVSINIMDAFVEMRKFIANNANMFNRLTTVEYKLLEHDKKFDEVFNELQKKEESEFKQKIFFEGQIYDAYSLIINIIKSAKSKILIIDNYIDDTILEMLTKKNKDVDDKELYHVGASLKDLGKKCFAISKIEDIEYMEKIQNKWFQIGTTCKNYN